MAATPDAAGASGASTGAHTTIPGPELTAEGRRMTDIVDIGELSEQVLTRRSFLTCLELEKRRSDRNGLPLSLIVATINAHDIGCEAAERTIDALKNSKTFNGFYRPSRCEQDCRAAS